MQAFSFQTVPTLVIEPGVAASLGALIDRLGCRKLFLVTDQGIVDQGLLAPVLAGLSAHGIGASVYAGVQADPPVAVVQAAVQAARDTGVDGVLGLGGGSSLDVAKLVALLVRSGEALDAVYGVGVARGPRLPLMLLPTTAGTGSEVTPIAIVTAADGQKKGVVSPWLLPDVAVLDAELTVSLPPAVTAATGIDAMVHAIEAYTSRRLKNPLSDCLACEALRLLGSHIETAVEYGDRRDARSAMLLGSMLAGQAFANAPVGGVHALAYPVGARFHVPHGLSNALVLPGVLRFNLDAAQDLYARLAEVLVPQAGGSTRERARTLLEWLTELPARLGLPTRLRDVGIAATDIDLLAAEAMQQTRLLANNPVEIRMDDAKSIYQGVL